MNGLVGQAIERGGPRDGEEDKKQEERRGVGQLGDYIRKKEEERKKEEKKSADLAER